MTDDWVQLSLFNLEDDEQRKIATEALLRFDGSYKSLMGELKKRKARQETFIAVNGAIKLVMQSSRNEVRDRSNPEEMNCWADGYTLTKETLNDIRFAAESAKSAFEKAKKKWGF